MTRGMSDEWKVIGSGGWYYWITATVTCNYPPNQP